MGPIAVRTVTFGPGGDVDFVAQGEDTVTIVDIGTDPANPKIVASLPLMNSIFGPPTNLAITPNGQIALVANSMDWVADGGNWRAVVDGLRPHTARLWNALPVEIGRAHV